MKASWIISLAACAISVFCTEESTTFNGEKVPPMNQLTGTDIDKTISKGYWLVEFYSPWCPHCQMLAPILQTVYEFYYTSKPLGTRSSDALNSFTGYYDFTFAKVDCVAWADACVSHGVESFPTIKLYKDGKELKVSLGALSLPELSKWIEGLLESIKPGSRPPAGPVLPEVGAHQAEQMRHVNNVNDQKPIPTLPFVKPNPDGKSVMLDQDSFRSKVVGSDNIWYIKFYAPWCHHCQTMAPNWSEMAQESRGLLNVGEVNCEKHKKLCSDQKIKGFPSLYVYKGEERIEFDGLRGVGDLVSYAKSVAGAASSIEDIDLDDFKQMEEKEQVIFIYFYNHATVTEDFAALQHLFLPLIGKARLVKTGDEKLATRFKAASWPSIMVWRSDKTKFYPYLAPKDMRDYKQILGWMQTVWQPLLPELTASNAKEIMTDSILALGVLSRDRKDEFAAAKREMKDAALEWTDRETHARQLELQALRDAKQLRKEEAEDRGNQKAKERIQQVQIKLSKPVNVRFAWIDGVFWQRWLKKSYGISVADAGERLIIIDEYNHRFWDTTASGNPITPRRKDILETLPHVLARPPRLPAKSSASMLTTSYYRLRASFIDHPWFTSFVIMAIVFGIISLFNRLRRRGRSWSSNGLLGGDGERGCLESGAKKD